MGLRELQDASMTEFEYEVWGEFMKEIGAAQFGSICVSELLEDIDYDKNELEISTWEIYRLISDIKFQERGYHTATLAMDIEQDWELFLALRHDIRAAATMRGIRG